MGTKTSLESPWNIALESAHRATPPTLLGCVLGHSHPPGTTQLPNPKELGNLPCSPLRETLPVWNDGTRKTCAVLLACFHVLQQLGS